MRTKNKLEVTTPTTAVNKANEKHLAVNVPPDCEIVHLVRHLNTSVVALQKAVIRIYSVE